MKNLSVLLLFLSLCIGSMAQQVDKEAKEQLDKISKALLKSTGTRADFTMTITDSKSGEEDSMDGVLYFKQNKFKLEIDGGEAYYDGTNQWVYMEDSDEITVSIPTEEDLQYLNPAAIISSYQQGYQLQKEKDKTVNGKAAYVISIHPEDRSKPFHRVEIVADKTTYNLLSVSTFGKDGMNTVIKINKFLTNQNFSDTLFVFDKKKYPGAELIDLR